MPNNLIDLTGQRFGRLLVKKITAKLGRRTNWQCECDCGTSTSSTTLSLRRKVRPKLSCGCLTAINTKIANTTHGKKRSAEYRSWTAMLSRCRNPGSKDYPRYGAAGIRVCARWLSFENFHADMGDRPEGKTLDRYPDKRGHYEPGNCRWATPLEQARNRRPRGAA